MGKILKNRRIPKKWYRIESGKVDCTPGLYHFDGNLYCVQDDGTILRDGVAYGMEFLKNGAYTSGYAVIDSYIRGIIAGCTNDSMTQREKFYACYSYVFYHIQYRSIHPYVERGADWHSWAPQYMIRLINEGKGNCFCYAAFTLFLARQLGYWDSRAVSGDVYTASYRHSWCEITIDDVKTVTDPELESKNFLTPGHVFLTPYSQTPTQMKCFYY